MPCCGIGQPPRHAHCLVFNARVEAHHAHSCLSYSLSACSAQSAAAHAVVNGKFEQPGGEPTRQDTIPPAAGAAHRMADNGLGFQICRAATRTTFHPTWNLLRQFRAQQQHRWRCIRRYGTGISAVHGHLPPGAAAGIETTRQLLLGRRVWGSVTYQPKPTLTEPSSRS